VASEVVVVAVIIILVHTAALTGNGKVEAKHLIPEKLADLL
jgi:hypothetical protein